MSLKREKIVAYGQALTESGAAVDNNLRPLQRALNDIGPGHFKETATGIRYVQELLPGEVQLKVLSVLVPIALTGLAVAVAPGEQIGTLVASASGVAGAKVFKHAREVLAGGVNNYK